jgi:hypothetical protein
MKRKAPQLRGFSNRKWPIFGTLQLPYAVVFTKETTSWKAKLKSASLYLGSKTKTTFTAFYAVMARCG